MTTVTFNENEVSALLDTLNYVINQEFGVVSSQHHDIVDAVDSFKQDVFSKALLLKNIIKNQKEELTLFEQLHRTAFEKELNEDFDEYPLRSGKMVFFIDHFTDELHEVRCLLPSGAAILLDNDEVCIPVNKDSILVLQEINW
jgi:hypothetical protein